MKRIFIINGYESYPNATGRLNQTIVNHMTDQLSSSYEIKTTVVANGYIPEEESDKFRWADVVIFQSPVFWFSLPGAFKTYIDKVYEYGVFFKGSQTYGGGGLFTDKQYMLSLTWNATSEVFSNPGQFFEGKDVDEVMFHFHKIQEYVGMKPLPTFSLHDVVRNPDIDSFLKKLDEHLREVFLSEKEDHTNQILVG
ncbi:modulator of drug activity B [Seinonella peptonophila]|uniref:Modulator of drug activity B n=1 Tax=Seinonella peptonophila TaxID=112248 RepID=A0A1M4SRL5_9BACL|nr:NAD(P)H-dependent oxidoreductase [Seinonella peptonophila]SHE34815.1 modulator of drug activity B [Seinonella peptonophila]